MPTTLRDIACLGCACLCDDLQLTVVDGAVTQAANACPTGQQWFAQPVARVDASCWIAGERATLDEATTAAAKRLAAATRPYVAGLAGVSIDAQRHAVAIADQIGGVITGGGNASVQALITHGSVGATLGEVAQRADVVVFWRCDPATTHPRHFERYSLQPTSPWLPNGRTDRTVFAISDEETPTTAEADHTIPCHAETDDAALAVVRALTKNLPLDADAVRESTGADLDAWRELVDAVQKGRYVAVFYDRQLSNAGRSALGALTAWMRDLQETTRCAALPLGGGMHQANGAGAAAVLAWQSGYAGTVDFGRGYPRQLDAEPVDADTLLVVSAETVSTEIRNVPRVLLATTETGCDLSAEVTFRVAPPGFAAKSSAYRSDGVALPLRHPWASDALAAETVLAKIAAALTTSATATTAASAP